VLARLTGKSGGIEDLNIAEYPGPLGIHDPAQITQNIESDLVGKIIAGLTGGSGEAAAASAKRNPKDIVFTGTPEEVGRYFDEQEWGDGLPIVVPTVERVEQFLKFTDRAPDEVVAVLQSANLQATPWIIAVNAVMAGCRPEHMPLIIAAVEALGDERCSLNNIGTSSGLFPFVLINGPIVDQLGINSGAQLASRPPNPAIGRAIGLIVRNIAGFRPGSSYMGTFGYPLAVALAERAEKLAGEHLASGRLARERILSETRQRLRIEEQREVLAAKAQAERAYQQQVQSAELSLRADLDRVRWELVNAVLDDLPARLAELAGDDASYLPLLRDYLREGAESIERDELVVRVNARDLPRLRKDWEKYAKEAAPGKRLTLSPETLDGTGGVLIVSSDGNIRLDNTFEGRMERLEETLQSAVAERLMPQQTGEAKSG